MNNIRILTSTSLFDGHDASINIMRRVLQEKGAEIIHFGHNRSAQEIVAAAIEEDVQGIAITSYQGGHIEFFTYVRKLLNEAGYQHIKIRRWWRYYFTKRSSLFRENWYLQNIFT